jgi:hypothetical protein
LKLKRSWMQAAEQLAKTVKGLNQMTFLEGIYPQVAAIRQISTDEFSKDFLGMGASYYRSMKARQLNASTSVLVTLMERLGEQAIVMRTGSPHSLILRAAEKYEKLGEEVGREIARRSLQQVNQRKWVRETLYRIVNGVNADREQQRDAGRWSAPPIIIC